MATLFGTDDGLLDLLPELFQSGETIQTLLQLEVFHFFLDALVLLSPEERDQVQLERVALAELLHVQEGLFEGYSQGPEFMLQF